MQQCNWCKKPIGDGAKVCPECGRAQGGMGRIASIGTVIGVVVALLGALLSSYQAFQTAIDSRDVAAAREKAREAADDSSRALDEARSAARSADGAAQNIEAIARDMLSLHNMSLFDFYDAVLANRQNCPPGRCPELDRLVGQLDRYYRYVVSQDQSYLSAEEKARLDNLWCGNVARLFSYYKSHSSIDNLAEGFIAQCEDSHSKSVDEVRKRIGG